MLIPFANELERKIFTASNKLIKNIIGEVTFRHRNPAVGSFVGRITCDHDKQFPLTGHREI